MELEDQVVSPELAKKLKESGVAQNNLFVWQRFESQGLWSGWQLGTVHEDVFPDEYVPAFTVAELGEMLPKSINWGQGFKDFEQIYHEERKLWIVRYYAPGSGIAPRMEEAKTEADARAAMLIYLLENKLINQ